MRASNETQIAVGAIADAPRGAFAASFVEVEKMLIDMCLQASLE
jgi:hypothetical protein